MTHKEFITAMLDLVRKMNEKSHTHGLRYYFGCTPESVMIYSTADAADAYMVNEYYTFRSFKGFEDLYNGIVHGLKQYRHWSF